MDLSLCWLYAEYSQYIENRDDETDIVALENYNCCIQMILSILADKKVDWKFTGVMYLNQICNLKY